MSETITINIIEAEQQVTINVNEVLGSDGEQGPPGDGYTHTSEDFTGSTSNTIVLANVYVPGSVRLYKNGARLSNSSFSEAGESILDVTADTIVLNIVRIAEDEFIIDYKY